MSFDIRNCKLYYLTQIERMRICIHQNIAVKYEEIYNVVFVKWKKFCIYDDYRKPLEYALES